MKANTVWIFAAAILIGGCTAPAPSQDTRHVKAVCTYQQQGTTLKTTVTADSYNSLTETMVTEGFFYDPALKSSGQGEEEQETLRQIMDAWKQRKIEEMKEQLGSDAFVFEVTPQENGVKTITRFDDLSLIPSHADDPNSVFKNFVESFEPGTCEWSELEE